MGKYVLGIDSGGTITKAGLFDAFGREIAVSSKTTKMLFPKPGHTERDMEKMWSANVAVIRSVIEKSRVNSADIVGVSLTGHGNGLYLVGENGEYITNGIVSTDTRASGYVDSWNKRGVTKKVYKKTLQNIWAAQPPALLAWFRDNQPEILKKTRWIFSCKDFIRYKLTGKAANELTDLSGMNMMNNWSGLVDSSVLSLFGIEFVKDLLPPPIWSTDVAGGVSSEAAKATGLKEGTVVAGGLFDIVAMAIASGVISSEVLCVIGGTWSINEFVTPTPVESPKISMNSLYCIPGLFLVVDATPTSASNFEWFVTQLFSFKNDKVSKKEIFKVCDTLVEETEFEPDIIFLPFLFGSNVSLSGSSAFVGMSARHHTAHVIRAVYEGIVFSHKTHIDRLLEKRNSFEYIRISGGVSKSDVWVQMFSDVLQCPIEVTGGDELGCLGAAMTAGVASGMFNSYQDAIDKTLRIKKRFYPKKEMAKQYLEKYNYYNSVISALIPIWEIKKNY